MKAYRDRYAELEASGAQVLAVSTDDHETQARFKASLSAPFSFIADRERSLVGLFGVRAPVIKMAQRVTFGIGEGRRIQYVESGGDAVRAGAVSACQSGVCSIG